MPTSRFYGLPNRHPSHKPWRLQIKSREALRGAIRGAAARERLLYPSQAKAMQRRIRLRLVAAYIRRSAWMNSRSSSVFPKSCRSPGTTGCLEAMLGGASASLGMCQNGALAMVIQACCPMPGPNPSIERTVTSGLRPLVTAAHVKR